MLFLEYLGFLSCFDPYIGSNPLLFTLSEDVAKQILNHGETQRL